MRYFRISKSLTTSVACFRELTARPRPATAKRRLRVQLAVLPLTIIMLSAASPRGIYIHTRDSLSLRQGIYSSLFFVAEPARTPDSNLPVQYRFTESGVTPPGMRFEIYPCNKPDVTVCPQVASSNGIFLDGTPTEAGSYTFVITATDTDQRRASQQFTVVVNPSGRAK
jgi:hypothetical protein